MKREAGESPARTRRCKEGVLFQIVTDVCVGKTKQNVDNQVRRPAYYGTWKTTSNWLVHKDPYVVTAFLRVFAKRLFCLL